MHIDYTPSDIERFWAHVDKSGGPDACWLWQGANVRGYGRFKCLGKQWATHRFAYTLLRGDVPAGLWVLHLCDNPPCVNPAHLWLGTHKDNMADMKQKGRAPHGPRSGDHVRGTKNINAKLTEEDVINIRTLYAKGGISQTKLAHLYGVSQTNIGVIIRREWWKHI